MRSHCGDPYCISATHGQGTADLMKRGARGHRAGRGAEDPSQSSAIRIAVIGRPNVGKSTLVNRFIGEERVIASDMPGTTRDSILVPFSRDEREFMLIDTAGIRRRSKVDDVIERVSVAKTLQAIDHAHVVIHLVDAHEQVGEQDASVLGLALQRGRALIIAVNKWDHIPMEQRDEIRRQVELKLDFVPFAPVHFISARHGTGVGDLVGDIIHAYESAMREMRTNELTRTLEHAMTVHQPPLVHGRRIKLRYAHQGGRNPPRIVIHGNQTVHVPDAYARYLAERVPQDVRPVRYTGLGGVSQRQESVHRAPAREAPVERAARQSHREKIRAARIAVPRRRRRTRSGKKAKREARLESRSGKPSSRGPAPSRPDPQSLISGFAARSKTLQDLPRSSLKSPVAAFFFAAGAAGFGSGGRNNAGSTIVRLSVTPQCR